MLALALAAGIAACSLAFPANEAQCSATADCVARGEAFANSVCVGSVCSPPNAGLDAQVVSEASAANVVDVFHDDSPWGCVGHVRWPDASPGSVAIAVPYIDSVTRAPIPGIVVEPCLTLDPQCLSPLAEAGITDDAGTVTFSVPSGFDGYLQSVWDGGFPTTAYVGRPVSTGYVVPHIPMLSTETASELPLAFGLIDGSYYSVDPRLGAIILVMADCEGVQGNNPGVSVAMSPPSPSSLQFYTSNGALSATATSTDVEGGGGFLNVPPGSFTLTATLVATDQFIGATTVYVRAGTVTYVDLPPTPTP